MPEIGPTGRRGAEPPPFRHNGGHLVVSTEGAPKHFFGDYPIERRLLAAIDA